ncbi:VOC family protein [Kaarinaea lacus]
MNKPNSTIGMRHVALNVIDVDACERFYVDLMGMKVEWRPDPDNVYLTSGHDNLAIHRATDEANGAQALDHIGFMLNDINDVDDWYKYLKANGVEIVKQPRTHRDGARSFYCLDPAGVVVQLIYHPPLANTQVKN